MRRATPYLILPLLLLSGCGDPPATQDPPAGGAPIEVSIHAPAGGSAYAPGEIITFEGSARDTATDQLLPAGSLRWTSNLSGQIGLGARVATALPEGDHTVTLTATQGSHVATAKINLSVQVPPLTATIRAPIDRSLHQSGAAIDFLCEARAGGAVVTAATYRWTAGGSQLGLGGQVTTAMPDGTHLVQCEATDPATGATATDTVTVKVGEPGLRITEPRHLAEVDATRPTTFSALILSQDPAPYTVRWESDLDGQIGLGQSVQGALVTHGVHRITASWTDTQGAAASDTIQIDYRPPNQAPTVTITAPAADGERLKVGGTFAFAATATDPEDGDLAPSGKWRDPTVGPQGAGPALSFTPSLPGKYVLTFEVTDSRGAAASAKRVVYADPADGSPLSVTSQQGNTIETVTAGGEWVTDGNDFLHLGPSPLTLAPTDVLHPGGAQATSVATNGTLLVFGSDDGLSTCTGPADQLVCTDRWDLLDQALGTTAVNDVAVTSKGIIFAATDGGLFVLHSSGANVGYQGADWNGSDRVRDIELDDQGQLWMATRTGLVRHDVLSGAFLTFPPDALPDPDLRAVTERAGVVWVGHDLGVSRLTGASPATAGFRSYGAAEGLQNPRVRNLDLDSKGILWGGTNGGGAFRLDGQIGQYLIIDTSDGLPDLDVRASYVDTNDEKWFGTAAGLFHYRGQ